MVPSCASCSESGPYQDRRPSAGKLCVPRQTVSPAGGSVRRRRISLQHAHLVVVKPSRESAVIPSVTPTPRSSAPPSGMTGGQGRCAAGPEIGRVQRYPDTRPPSSAASPAARLGYRAFGNADPVSTPDQQIRRSSSWRRAAALLSALSLSARCCCLLSAAAPTRTGRWLPGPAGRGSRFSIFIVRWVIPPAWARSGAAPAILLARAEIPRDHLVSEPRFSTLQHSLIAADAFRPVIKLPEIRRGGAARLMQPDNAIAKVAQKGAVVPAGHRDAHLFGCVHMAARPAECRVPCRARGPAARLRRTARHSSGPDQDQAVAEFLGLVDEASCRSHVLRSHPRQIGGLRQIGDTGARRNPQAALIAGAAAIGFIGRICRHCARQRLGIPGMQRRVDQRQPSPD